MDRVRIFRLSRKKSKYRLVLYPAGGGPMTVGISGLAGVERVPVHVRSARDATTGEKLPVDTDGRIGPVPVGAWPPRRVWNLDLVEEDLRVFEVTVGEDSYRSFTWPVLRPSSDDVSSVLRSSFRAVPKGKFHSDAEVFAEVANAKLAEYIEQGMAEYEILVERDHVKPFARRFAESPDKFRVPNLSFGARFKISTSIIATKNINNYTSGDFHKDYEGRSFRVRSGEYLALGEARTYEMMPSARVRLEGFPLTICELGPRIPLVWEEFHDYILPSFVRAEGSASEHISPHSLEVITNRGGEALLTMEIVTGAEAAGYGPRRRITLAAWDKKTKILKYLPGAVIDPLTLRLLQETGIREGYQPEEPLAGILDEIFKQLGIAFHGNPLAGRDFLHLLWMEPWDDTTVWRYFKDPNQSAYLPYPFILDVGRLRIVNPDIPWLFLGQTRLKEKELLRYVLDKLSEMGGSPVPRNIRDNVRRKMLNMSLDRSTGQEQ